MSVTSESYQRKKTGYYMPRECCPADGQARRSGCKNHEELVRQQLPPSFKQKVSFNIALGYYEVPSYMIDEAKGISISSATAATLAVDLQCIHDETADTMYLAPNIIHKCQPYRIYSAATTAVDIFIWF